MWDLIVSVPDHCLSFYFEIKVTDFEILRSSFWLKVFFYFSVMKTT